MAQQGTEEQQADSEQQAGDEASGKHRSSGDEQASSGDQADGQSSSGDQDSSSEQKTEQQQSSSEQKSQESSSDEQKTQQTQKQDSAPGEQKTDKQQAPSEQKTEKQQAPAEQKNEQKRGNADTSWAEPEQSHKRSLDVGELAWRTGNVIATVVRTLALLFALVLIVNVVLILVGVNPANGVAQFIGGVADTVILGFRNLFVPANPTVGLIVNSLIAAVFWVFVGELVSRVIRFVAARVK